MSAPRKPKSQHNRQKDTEKKHRRHWKSPCDRPPIAPLNPVSSFDRVGARHLKIRLKMRWDEVHEDTSGFRLTLRNYVVVVEYSADQVNWFLDVRRNVSAKFDDDPGTQDHLIVKHLNKKFAYRWRVRAVALNGCKSDWTAWQNMGTPGPEEPPAPSNVVIFEKAHDKIILDWDPPLETLDDDILDEKVAHFAAQISRNSNFYLYAFTSAADDNLTVSGGHLLIAGDRVKLVGASLGGGLAQNIWYFVVSPTGTTFKVSLTLGGAPVDVTSGGSGTATTIYKHDKFVHLSRKGFVIPKTDRQDGFYGRARSVSTDRDKSAWIPAKLDPGNSDPLGVPDAAFCRLEKTVATWTKPGSVVAQAYQQLYTCHDDLKAIQARAHCGEHTIAAHPADGCPQGADMLIQIVWHDGTNEDTHQNIFATDSKLIIAAGTHTDVNWTADFNKTLFAKGDTLSVKVVQVGSTAPGTDLVVHLTMVPQ
jgi:hypothetical protein